MYSSFRIILFSFFFSFTFLVNIAWAADTLETWNVGAMDVEFYLSYNSLIKVPTRDTLGANMLLGYGFSKKISGYIQTTMQGNTLLGGASSLQNMGLYVTALERKHVDIDLLMDLSVTDHNLAVKFLTEINLDLGTIPFWGFYLRSALKAYGSKSVSTVNKAGKGRKRVETQELLFIVESVLGAYYTLKKDHQILLEVDFVYRPKPKPNQHQFDLGGWALGWNYKFHKTVEWINELHFEIPKYDKGWEIRFTTGFIASFP